MILQTMEDMPKSCKGCPHSDHEAWCLEPGSWKDRYYLPDDCISNACPYGWGNEDE